MKPDNQRAIKKSVSFPLWMWAEIERRAAKGFGFVPSRYLQHLVGKDVNSTDTAGSIEGKILSADARAVKSSRTKHPASRKGVAPASKAPLKKGAPKAP